MNDVAKIARSSQEDGAAVANALTTPGARRPRRSRRPLRGIADQERQNVEQAQSLDPPGPLRPENQQLIEALQLRISGVDGLAKTIEELRRRRRRVRLHCSRRSPTGCSRATSSGPTSSRCPSKTVMSNEGVKGVAPPDSTFVANRQLFAETSLNLMLSRLRGASTGGHGDRPARHEHRRHEGAARATTRCRPTPRTRSPRRPNLAFVVTVEDSGDAQEVNIVVTMTMKKDGGGKAIVQTKKISVINPSQKKTVSFTGINTSGYFAVKSHLRDRREAGAG